MDILLSHGYFLDQDPQEAEVMRPYPPLGLLYLSSHLKSRGFEVEVFDSTFSDPASFRQKLHTDRPAVVGLYCNLLTRRSTLDLAHWCKQQDAVVVAGGPEPAAYAAEYLARGVDVVVVGEGELTLEELLPHLARHGLNGLERIQGIVYRRDGGEIHRTRPRAFIQSLDAQPFPDREAIDIERYLQAWKQHHGLSAVSLITSRGCPYTCTWCSHGVFGYSHRSRSAASVADEVELIRERYRPDMLWYADDVFTLNPRWFFEFSRLLKERGLVTPFETISREDRLDPEIIGELAAIGCRRLWIGSESGSQRILDAMQRRTNARRVRTMIRLLQRHGIEAGLFVMMGYEGEDLADMEATVEHLKAARPDVFLSTVAYPIKGTPYYQEVADRIIPLRNWSEGSDRDLAIRGRHSRRFYRFAQRWMAGEVALERARANGSRDYLATIKALANARLGRMGMRLTRSEREA